MWWFALIAILAVFSYLYYRKVLTIQSLCQQLREYKLRTEELSAEKTDLEREIDSLLNDPDKLEELARDKLGMAGEDERIFIIVPTPISERHSD